MTVSEAITATQHWLENFIIRYNICPFAKKVFDEQTIRYQLVDASTWEAALVTLNDEWRYLNAHPECATTLIIFYNGLTDFNDYLDVVDIADGLLAKQGYEGLYQLASFHPDYVFADSTKDDPANYSNRSPYPMLHIIRESSITDALESFAHPEDIPQRNIRLLREMGGSKIRAMLTGKN